MAEEPIYKDSLENLARRFEGRVGVFIAGEISAWQNSQRQFISELISSEKQKRLKGIAERFEEAQGDALRELMQELRQELVAMEAEVSVSAPEHVEKFREVTSVIEGLVQRVLDNGLPLERDILAELRSRNIPRFPEDQRSVPRKDRVDPLEFLREHYSEFLVYFGAPRNLISQADLRQSDPGLLSALKNRIDYLARKLEADLELREVIPRYADLVTERLGEIPREHLLSSARLAQALRFRESKEEK